MASLINGLAAASYLNADVKNSLWVLRIVSNSLLGSTSTAGVAPWLTITSLI